MMEVSLIRQLKGKKQREFKALLEQETSTCIAVLVDIAKHGANDSDRIKAATAILDRCYGKPAPAVDKKQAEPVDTKQLLSVLADTARGAMVEQNSDGTQRIVITPSKQIDNAIPVEGYTVDDKH